MKLTVEHILKNYNLSVTDNRIKILQFFLQQHGALSHRLIEKKFGNNMDRVTIYRTLQSFVEKGILHTIPTSDSSVQYALCKEHCSAGHHHDNHVHFVCDDCGSTTCLQKTTIPVVKLPKGFKPYQFEMIVSGKCKNCA